MTERKNPSTVDQAATIHAVGEVSRCQRENVKGFLPSLIEVAAPGAVMRLHTMPVSAGAADLGRQLGDVAIPVVEDNFVQRVHRIGSKLNRILCDHGLDCGRAVTNPRPVPGDHGATSDRYFGVVRVDPPDPLNLSIRGFVTAYSELWRFVEEDVAQDRLGVLEVSALAESMAIIGSLPQLLGGQHHDQ